MSRALYGARAGEEVQRGWLRTAEVPVAVYGLGKMGLPLAAVYAETTGNVTGVDIDEAVVGAINAGECPVEREPGLPELVASLVSRGALAATTDGAAAAADASLHVVIVPTLVEDGEPDLSAVQSVVRDVAAGLEAGDTVVFESTLPPGATEDVLVPLLAAESGLDPDAFGVAFCPERTSSGRALRDVRGTHPKVVGGTDPEATRVAELVYDEVVDNELVPVSDARTAEAVKVFEGLYRDANIALANDLARLADDLDVDVREAIDAANTQPYCEIHTPGPGVGGHCIPYYPYFVLGWLDRDAPLVGTAREVNDAMPAFVADRVAEGLAAEERASDGAEGGDDGENAAGDEPARTDEREPAGATGATDTADRSPEAGTSVRDEVPTFDPTADSPAAGDEAPTFDPTAGGAAADGPDATDFEDLSGANVAVLGLTYRAGVKETRASPGVAVCEQLAERGATVHAADPLVDADGVPAKDVHVEDLPVLDLDATDHRHYVVGRGWQ